MPVAAAVDLANFSAFAKPLVESGRYASPNEVLSAAMKALEREADEEAKEAWLLEAIEEGEASGLAEGDVIGRIFERAGISASLRG